MAEYDLYCFKESGNAYKAAIMLELAGCDWSARWVDFFNGVETPATRRLDELLDLEPIAVGDLILTEVLQGFRQQELT